MDRIWWGLTACVVSCGLFSVLYRFIIIIVVERVLNPSRDPSSHLLCAPTDRRASGTRVCRHCAFTITVRGCSVRRHGPVSLLLFLCRVGYMCHAIFRCGVLSGCVRYSGHRFGVCWPHPSRFVLCLQRPGPRTCPLSDCAQSMFGFGCGGVIGPLLTAPVRASVRGYRSLTSCSQVA